MITRWIFHDPDGVLDDWTFPNNPSRRDPPQLVENVQPTSADLHGHHYDSVAAPSPTTESWDGVFYTLVNLDVFQAWLDNARPVRVTDHFGLRYLLMIDSLDTQRAGSKRHPERHKYTAHVSVIKELGL
jgi:hypothetical protein